MVWVKQLEQQWTGLKRLLSSWASSSWSGRDIKTWRTRGEAANHSYWKRKWFRLVKLLNSCSLGSWDLKKNVCDFKRLGSSKISLPWVLLTNTEEHKLRPIFTCEGLTVAEHVGMCCLFCQVRRAVPIGRNSSLLRNFQSKESLIRIPPMNYFENYRPKLPRGGGGLQASSP